MKKYLITMIVLALAISLCGCNMGGADSTPETTEATEKRETEPPVTVPSLPPLQPNIPEETDNRGSTDDTTDAPNETLPEDMNRMRRKILG